MAQSRSHPRIRTWDLAHLHGARVDFQEPVAGCLPVGCSKRRELCLGGNVIPHPEKGILAAIVRRGMFVRVIVLDGSPGWQFLPGEVGLIGKAGKI
jgi:hypothetical protein